MGGAARRGRSGGAEAGGGGVATGGRGGEPALLLAGRQRRAGHRRSLAQGALRLPLLPGSARDPRVRARHGHLAQCLGGAAGAGLPATAAGRAAGCTPFGHAEFRRHRGGETGRRERGAHAALRARGWPGGSALRGAGCGPGTAAHLRHGRHLHRRGPHRRRAAPHPRGAHRPLAGGGAHGGDAHHRRRWRLHRLAGCRGHAPGGTRVRGRRSRPGLLWPRRALSHGHGRQPGAGPPAAPRLPGRRHGAGRGCRRIGHGRAGHRHAVLAPGSGGGHPGHRRRTHGPRPAHHLHPAGRGPGRFHPGLLRRRRRVARLLPGGKARHAPGHGSGSRGRALGAGDAGGAPRPAAHPHPPGTAVGARARSSAGRLRIDGRRRTGCAGGGGPSGGGMHAGAFHRSAVPGAVLHPGSGLAGQYRRGRGGVSPAPPGPLRPSHGAAGGTGEPAHGGTWQGPARDP